MVGRGWLVRERNRLEGIIESRQGRKEKNQGGVQPSRVGDGDATINRSASKSISKGERKQSNQKVNVEIEVNPRNDKHVDLHILQEKV